MKATLTLFAILAGVVIVIGGGIAWEVSLWHECRATNSFWYCMRVLGK